MEQTMTTAGERLQQSVYRVQRDNPDVGTVFVFDSRAQVHAAGDDQELVTTATAMLTPLRDLVERGAAELGCGNLGSMLIEGSEGCFALADVDGDRAVVVLGERDAAPGSLLADARQLAAGLRNEAW